MTNREVASARHEGMGGLRVRPGAEVGTVSECAGTADGQVADTKGAE